MIEPEITNPFITREVYAEERYVIPHTREVFPSPQFIFEDYEHWRY